MAHSSANVRRLCSIDLFANLSDDELARVDSLCRWQNCYSGQRIIDHLDETTDCFLIATGSVRVIVNTATGKEVAFRDMGAGEIVGELSAVDGRPRSASVVALTNASVGRLSSKALWDTIRRNPEAATLLIKRLTALIRDLSERVVAVSTLPIGLRVQAEMLRLARKAGIRENRAVILHAPTHAEIASRVAARREAVTREITMLTKAHIVNRRGRSLIVTDVAALQKSVEAVLDITAS